ncbi:hypothetical protein LIER_08730 [Lithospermum erythrorhizon]|uniref:RNase H type-1 domain-containing protein n=1 Tax=Lithospermum erythrorhizon TaxID=34254 RepID=A0AAV3PHU6_LITER
MVISREPVTQDCWNCEVKIGGYKTEDFRQDLVVIAEAMAIKDGLEFAVTSHWQKMEIESDSKQVIQVLNG